MAAFNQGISILVEKGDGLFRLALVGAVFVLAASAGHGLDWAPTGLFDMHLKPGVLNEV
ncbi:MAG: hypothetical protein J2P48_09450 [Alphaproteobacteria bacterium]|nr:hypothetical protein [Alphaproteobacteria bacterium]